MSASHTTEQNDNNGGAGSSGGASTNPLCQVQFEIPFDRIKAEHVRPAAEELLEASEAAIEVVAQGDGPRSYANTLAALEEATERLEWAMGIVGHLEAVATTPELRRAYNEIKPKVSEFYSKIPLNAGLYNALRELEASDEVASFSPTQRRFLDKTLREFRRHGAELREEDKQRLNKLDVALSKATTKYAQNVLDATNAFELIVPEERLAGLPASAKAAARASAEEKGKAGYRFTLQGPSIIAALTYLDDRGLRETLWRAYNTRATKGEHDNRPLVREILELRQKKAELLGYATFADLVLEERMAKSGDQARAFVNELREKTGTHFLEENRELAAFREEQLGDGAGPIKPWDVGYFAEKLRRHRFDFDEEELRQYFPVERVVNGLFETTSRLYGLRFEKAALPVWNPAVLTYAVYDRDNTHLGSFYCDLHPRDDKRGGAWMMGLLTGQPTQTPPEPHLGLFCANVNAAVPGHPALLTHREVETLFHEFGHLMHHMLSRVEVKSLACTNVAWDFVELPSQIMENWCWERSALDLFARHHETNEPIPDALFEKMTRARTFRAANGQMRQLGFASMDLALHIDWDASLGDPVEMAREHLVPFAATVLPEEYSLVTSFTHLFAASVAYAAGYYSYKWAEVLDADAFTRFQKEGIFSQEVGRAFWDEILAKGDSADPSDLYRAFMGREPNVQALMNRQGLR